MKDGRDYHTVKQIALNRESDDGERWCWQDLPDCRPPKKMEEGLMKEPQYFKL